MPTRSGVGLVAAAVLVIVSQTCTAPAATEDFGYLGVSHEHVKWPSPESVVRDLQSLNPDVRYKALLSVGVSESLARMPVWSGGGRPSTVIGSEVSKAEQIELRYAALGSDETQQAIVVAQVVGTYAFAAVATPTTTGWERIATFNCWCKYDLQSVTDTFVSLSLAPDPMRGGIQRNELVLRASGGGTGLYTQNEAHFRFHKGEMKAVMSFVSRVQTHLEGGPPPSYLEIERRWFSPALRLSPPNGPSEYVAVLVESRAKTVSPPAVYTFIPELQDLYLKGIACRTFRWNENLFQYDPVSVPNACKSH